MRVNMKIKAISSLLILSLATIFMTGCNKKTTLTETSMEDIEVKGFVAGASVHDPSIVVGEDGKYYIFGSHMEVAESDNLHNWKSIFTGVNSSNKLFDGLFEPDFTAFSYVGKNLEGGYSVWAPDVIYNEMMGKYVMYFCTTSSSIKSNLCFAVADELIGPYTYVDTILYSGFIEDTVSQTNFYDVMPKDTDMEEYLTNPSKYNNFSWPNCIDPNVFYDKEGKMWMTYGSWSGGIFILELDEKTGYPIHPESNKEQGVDTYFGKKLIGGLNNSIEGPYIFYNEETEYYYLFVSYGELTSHGGYQIRVFRSKEVDGTYVDAYGETMGAVASHSKFGVKIMGNYTLPSLNYSYMAPGHCSVFADSDGKMYVVYHTRYDNNSEYHEPRVHQLFTTKSGWLAAAPFATSKETLDKAGYQSSDLVGTFYYVNHGTDISDEIHTGKAVSFKSNGKIQGEVEGSYQIEDGTDDITITIGSNVFEGVIIDMKDEAGNETRCITAVGNNNETVWFVHYK